MRKLNKVAVAVSGALLLGYGATAGAVLIPPAGYADSVLNVTNFAILGFNPGTGMNYDLTVPSLAANGISSISANVTGTINTSLNLVPGSPLPGSNLSGASINPLANTIPAPSLHMQYLAGGPNPGFPLTSLPIGSINPGSYAAASLDHSGNGLNLNGNGLTTALTHNQVNLTAAGQGSSDSRQTLLTTFTITVPTGVPGLVFDVVFDAEADLRAALAQPGLNAQATRAWSLSVTSASSVLQLLWLPDGNPGGALFCAGVCAELDDDFSLNRGLSVLNVTDDLRASDSLGDFGIRFALAPGTYTATIGHFTSADVKVIPEPGSLALLGAALLGLAGLRRKSKKA